MGRPRKNTLTENIEDQIAKAQEKVIKTKASYDAAVDGLQKLLDKRDAQKKDELWNAIIKSDKSYDDILRYIKTENLDED